MELYAWGANSHGQLGINKFSEYELITKVNEIPGDQIKSITGGGGHTLIVDTAGSVYASGWNNRGQLGIGSTVDSNTFVKIQQTFDRVSCGFQCSAGITSDNRLFVWGCNRQNQLGFSTDEHKIITKPVELELPLGGKVVDVRFGLRHTAILTDFNQIYIIGSLKHFKHAKHEIINHKASEYLNVAHDSKIVCIASGQNHILYLDDQNIIRGIGDNKFKQCGDVSAGERIAQMSSGWTHNGFLTDSKELYLYGRNNYGQLGIGRKSDCEAVHKCEVHPVDDFRLGSEHGILKSNKCVYTWGWNEHGNCGDGSLDDVLRPRKIKLPNDCEALNIVAGSGFCMVLCKSSRLNK